MTVSLHARRSGDDTCPLCGGGAGRLRGPDTRRCRRCERCGLAFVERADLPDPASEATHYRTHVNRPDDPGYRAFLARVVGPLLPSLRPGMSVLDFGSGGGSPVSSLLMEHDVRVVEYDPVFRPERQALERRYDVIVASEVVEHFHAPAAAFDGLDRVLAPGGRLGVMTEPLEDEVDLRTWWYARDPTHVSFYAPRTMRWIARRFGWACRRVRPSVTLFDKPRGMVRSTERSTRQA